MAKKPHKLAWNGVDIDTVLSASDLSAICAQAAIESTGDLWNGKQKIEEGGRDDARVVYNIKSGLGVFAQVHLCFTVGFETNGTITKLKTTIDSYTTLQSKAYIFIPVGTKKMICHHTYMQFVHKVANTVRAADGSAVIRIREGVETYGAPSANISQGSQSSAFPAPTAATQAPSTPPPPPPSPAVAAAAQPLAPPPPPPPPPLAQAEIDDSTRRVNRKPRVPRGWQVALEDGRTIAVTGAMLIGRDPASDEGMDAALVTVPDTATLVSKTHALIDLIDGVPHVTDLHSSNGTFVVTPAGDDMQCEPGVPTPLKAREQVELGDYPLVIQRASVGSP